ncbi:AEC family transporter [Marinobacterium sp. YM272]|uniref:AEC family transporter n=1 Tax=Marinobacterium sp. YM272 TaxID=3421654 RepID=UPI003D7F9212
MLEAFLVPILPVLFIALLGALLSRTTTWLDNPALGQMVTNIGLPALLIHSLLNMQMDLSGMGLLILAMASTLVLSAVVTLVVLRLCGQPIRRYLSVLVNPNTGNLGIPVVFALFGEQALAIAVVVSSVVTISHFTLGVSVMSGSFAPRQLLRNAPALALLVAALLLGLDLQPPGFVMKTLDMVGGITLPIMLMMLGRSLADLKFGRSTEWTPLLLMAVYRPLVGLAAAATVVWVLGMDELEARVLMVQAAMPVAVISYVLTLRYEGPTDRVAGLILLSIPTSFAVVGILAHFWL